MSSLDWALRGTVGLYAGVLLVPLAAIISVESGNAPADATTLVASGGAVTVVFTLLAAGISDLDRQVATARVFVPMVGLPLGFFPYLLLQTPASAMAVVAVAGLTATVLGIVVAAIGATIVKRERLADATELVSFETGQEEDDGGIRFGQSGLLVGGILIGTGLFAFGGVVAAGFFEGDIPTTLFTTLAGLSGSLAAFAGDDSHEIRVTDTGIVVDDALLKRETTTDARFEDGEFVVERAGLWPDRTVDATELRGADRSEIESAVDRLT